MAAFGATWLFASGLPKVGNPPQTDVQPNAAAEDRVSHSLYRIAKIASFTSYPLGHEGLREGVADRGDGERGRLAATTNT
jgi:hypothetical protein